MAYSLNIRENASGLRKQGYSIKEISENLNIAKSTASLWVSSIQLDDLAQNRLRERKILGQYRAINTAKIKKEKLRAIYRKKALKSLKKICLNKELYKLLCSFLFWTEGGKSTDSYVYFINSDPKMVETFLILLQSAFKLDERKLRAMAQLHEYHNERDTLKYWSKLTNIPLKKFSKTYKKPHTGKRIREGYQGSLRIRYYDYKIALELRSFYNTFADIIGP